MHAKKRRKTKKSAESAIALINPTSGLRNTNRREHKGPVIADSRYEGPVDQNEQSSVGLNTLKVGKRP